MKTLIAIVGATATGKTALAIELAKIYQSQIISFDGRQFYQEMEIGTAKPSPQELAAAPHHFINHKSIKDNYTVADFEREGLILLDNLFQNHDILFAVGGSGLFLRALSQGLDPMPAVDLQVINQLEQRLATEGLAALQAELKTADPDTYYNIDLDNPRRLLRALSVCISSQKPFSSFKTFVPQARNFSTYLININYERENLYSRINQRVDLMIAAGLEAEALSLYPLRDLTALQTVGYSEWFDFFAHKLTRQEAIEKIKQHSRNYAKRQITWFKREPIALHLTGENNLADNIATATHFIDNLTR